VSVSVGSNQGSTGTLGWGTSRQNYLGKISLTCFLFITVVYKYNIDAQRVLESISCRFVYRRIGSVKLVRHSQLANSSTNC